MILLKIRSINRTWRAGVCIGLYTLPAPQPASMASVVFIRGVNVGGHKAFRPSVLASALSALQVVSVGAAGTFVVRADLDEKKIRASFLTQLPFEAQLMIASERELTGLVAANPFTAADVRQSDAQCICVLERPLTRRPPLPLYAPDPEHWKVALTGVRGRFVAALYRRMTGTMIYPNEVVEKRLGVAATTRGWPTILKIHQLLHTAPAAKVDRAARTPAAMRSRRT